MKKTYMRQAYMGMVGDIKNLEHHFSHMAEQGWMIDKIGVFTHRYRAIEPCKKHFFADFLPQITAFDYPENEDAQSYRAICEESGWHFIAANKQFHVFCADCENPAPVPIHTDNAIQAQIYLKMCRKNELLGFSFALFMLWFSSPFGRGIELFLSNMMLFMALGYCIFAVGYLWNFFFMLRWYLRTRKSAKNDLPLPTVNYRLARLRNGVFTVGIILFLICAFVGITLDVIGGMSAVILIVMIMPFTGIGVGLWIRRQVDTKRRTRKANIGIAIAAIVIMEIVFLGGMSFVIFRLLSTSPYSESDTLGNRPALTLHDVGDTTEPSYSSTRIKGTAVVPDDYEHWETNYQSGVQTHVYRSVSQLLSTKLYEHFSNELTEQYSYRTGDIIYSRESFVVYSADEAAFWGAEKGMTFNYGGSNAIEILLLNDKTILRISANSEKMDLDVVNQAVRNLWNGSNT